MKQCTIHVSVFKADPFNLDWGRRVWAKIVATNVKGDSEESDPGTGAVIISNPDPPVNLIENYSQRTAQTLGFAWEDGENDRGAEVTSYRVSYSINNVDGPYYILASVSTQSFLAYSLQFSNTYSFKVQSRNSYGYSEYSEVLTLYCAWVPEPPDPPSSEN
jgi:hypothetical protein